MYGCLHAQENAASMQKGGSASVHHQTNERRCVQPISLLAFCERHQGLRADVQAEVVQHVVGGKCSHAWPRLHAPAWTHPNQAVNWRLSAFWAQLTLSMRHTDMLPGLPAVKTCARLRHASQACDAHVTQPASLTETPLCKRLCGWWYSRAERGAPS